MLYSKSRNHTAFNGALSQTKEKIKDNTTNFFICYKSKTELRLV